jgi:VWFA-related protein
MILLLPLLLATAGPPDVAFQSPRPGDAVVSPVAIALEVRGSPTAVVVEVGGEPIATLTRPPWTLTWDAGTRRGAFELHARASFPEGGDRSATARIYLIRVDQVVEVPLVLVPVVVLDRGGHAVAGLLGDDFELRVDGDETAIEHFEGGDAPFALAIVLDASASMLGSRFEAAREAAQTLIRSLGPRDRALILTFDHRASVRSPPSSDRAALERELDLLATGGGTAIYDALALAIQMLEGEPGRKAIVLLSDGADATSRTSPDAVSRAARRSQVVLYSVVVSDELGRGIPTTPPTLSAEGRRLKLLAEDLGGRSIAPGSLAELVGAYLGVFEEMRSQYTLGFAPSGRADGKWHRIEVSARVPAISIRARRGFLWARP